MKLLAPLPRPPKGVIGIGLNYAEHVEESSRTMETQKELPTHPVIFMKPSTSIIGPDDAIVHNPAITEMLDYEAELGVVLGRRCRNVGADEAMAYVFGYTCVKDVSARDCRHGGQWTFAKGQDTFAPMGPWIVTADEIADPHDLAIGLTLNGVQKQNSNTRHMIFKIPALIAHLSSAMTLEPGDVIATGTPEGVGISFKPPQFMKAGDVVEMRVEGVGTLRNTVKAA
ncbi:MAG: Fumarylacetoacetate hydrolase family protein [uncultured Microvirga sp.]|uniref:Fumarylacetoacetate hydrolase family protein n=1 Tax=uncultured Microvirga sp. TaxID=412392 RepID=A0A6J4M879_9HYPH|nr:MAG: Fumarylacetoacetate hydrolase family protein [uncultured Microvirga sp.]